MFLVIDANGETQAECATYMGALRVFDAMTQRGKRADIVGTESMSTPIVEPQEQLRSSVHVSGPYASRST